MIVFFELRRFLIVIGVSIGNRFAIEYWTPQICGASVPGESRNVTRSAALE
jgi:hypothetical protein